MKSKKTNFQLIIRNCILVSFALLFCNANVYCQTESKSEMLCKTWQVQEVKGKAFGEEGVIYLKGGKANEKDFSKMRYIFRPNGDYEGISDEGIKSTSTLRWKFFDNENIIEISNVTKGKSIRYNVISIKDNLLQLSVRKLGATVYFIMIPE